MSLWKILRLFWIFLIYLIIFYILRDPRGRRRRLPRAIIVGRIHDILNYCPYLPTMTNKKVACPHGYVNIERLLYCKLLFFFKHLYWSIIALQWCVSFCFITKLISYTYTICSHISSLLHFPPSHPPHPTPLGGHKAPSWSPCAMRLLPTSYLFYIW